jgi:hypothetical protein
MADIEISILPCFFDFPLIFIQPKKLIQHLNYPRINMHQRYSFQLISNFQKSIQNLYKRTTSLLVGNIYYTSIFGTLLSSCKIKN